MSARACSRRRRGRARRRRRPAGSRTSSSPPCPTSCAPRSPRSWAGPTCCAGGGSTRPPPCAGWKPSSATPPPRPRSSRTSSTSPGWWGPSSASTCARCSSRPSPPPPSSRSSPPPPRRASRSRPCSTPAPASWPAIPTGCGRSCGNLVANAVKFTPPGGRVTVRVERVPPASVRLVVEDTGEGISAEFLPHVFERFRQGDSSNTRSHGGLGLGLAIARHLVELHGGTIEARSEGEGRARPSRCSCRRRSRAAASGRARLRPRPRRDDVPHGGRADLTGVRVLVVDDGEDVREVVSAVLGQCGAEVRPWARPARPCRPWETSLPTCS